MGQGYIIDEKGRKKAVVVPVKEYEKLLENLHDLQTVAERRGNPKLGAAELRTRLREGGLL